jgi:hypothetical protein
MTRKKLYVFAISLVTFITLSIPLITDIPRFNNENPITVNLSVCTVATTEKSLFILRFVTICLVSLVTFAVQYYKVYKPAMKLDVLREKTLSLILEPHLKKLRGANRKYLRLNIMRKKTYFKLGSRFFICKLQPLFHSGFKADHIDKCLSFWIIKMPFYEKAEGNCGLSLLEEQVKIGDLRDPEHYHFDLHGQKALLTRGVRFVLSIPIYKWDNSHHSVEGILNIDTLDSKSATALLADQEYLKKVIDNFLDLSDYIAGWL